MLGFIIKRLVQAIPTMLLTSFGIFTLVRMIPGDPAVAMAGPDAPQAVLDQIRRNLALDQPIPVQFVAWLEKMATGDFGASFQARVPVTDVLAQAFPATLQLVLVSTLLGATLGILFGVVAAVFRRTWIDVSISGVTAAMMGVPNFWLGLLGIIVFALVFGWLPPGGRVDPAQNLGLALKSMILPAAVLGLLQAAAISRFTRASMIEVLQEGYVRTAHAKGLSVRSVLGDHALRNALIPVITIIGIEMGRLLGGAVVVETVFAWPGMGRLVTSAIGARDYPVIQAVLLVMMTVFIVLNLFTDLLYGVLDPRVRQGARS